MECVFETVKSIWSWCDHSSGTYRTITVANRSSIPPYPHLLVFPIPHSPFPVSVNRLIVGFRGLERAPFGNHPSRSTVVMDTTRSRFLIRPNLNLGLVFHPPYIPLRWWNSSPEGCFMIAQGFRARIYTYPVFSVVCRISDMLTKTKKFTKSFRK